MIASRLPCLSMGELLYNRQDSSFLRPPEADAYTKLMLRLSSLKASESELAVLLKDSDPKIRALAIVALLDKNDPTALPEIVPLADDPALTFPEITPRDNLFLSSSISDKKQSVGSIASAVVNFYLQQAGFNYGIKGLTGHNGFEKYWSERKDRKYCASWFVIQLLRASRGIRPMPAQYVPDVLQVRARVEALPAEDRAWMFLWLRGACPQDSVDKSIADAFAKEADVVKEAGLLGPDKLVLMLQRRIPSNDPDLQPMSNGSPYYGAMTLFILQHAKSLLRPQDADTLLAQSLWEKDNVYHQILDPMITPWWAIAAAQLQPEKAENILHDQYPLFQDKYSEDSLAQLGVALWRQVGESQSDFLVDWYYDELLKTQPQAYVDWRNTFIDGIAQTDKPPGKALIAKILTSPRCETIDWESLEHLSLAINAWTPQPVISSDELNAVDIGKSPELEAKLVQRLRLSVPLWSHQR